MNSKSLPLQKLHSGDSWLAIRTRCLSLTPHHDVNLPELEFNSQENESLYKWTQNGPCYKWHHTWRRVTIKLLSKINTENNFVSLLYFRRIISLIVRSALTAYSRMYTNKLKYSLVLLYLCVSKLFLVLFKNHYSLNISICGLSIIYTLD